MAAFFLVELEARAAEASREIIPNPKIIVVLFRFAIALPVMMLRDCNSLKVRNDNQDAITHAIESEAYPTHRFGSIKTAISKSIPVMRLGRAR